MSELIHSETPSPNWNQRQLPISMVVMHYTGMRTGAEALERLCNPAAEVSAHYAIEEDGTVHRLVREDRRAWHAGRGFWRGVSDARGQFLPETGRGTSEAGGGAQAAWPDFSMSRHAEGAPPPSCGWSPSPCQGGM